ncbi:bifunctional riboflavin kinase/FAD synthetase [Kallotenue papyrolyticum]|uniref:bifunctional riboflavin kinase/FAD synthetase n=1 Tax=Kallotenue papyrolyticum TaxID=1325125 RepID=UPI0004785317|nr:bifunctional riboflavin kinase/FAD synthetase [Kallotenue papyrolyticum]
MQCYRSLDQAATATPTILTIGKFNGMHLGHHYLLEQVVQRARAIGGLSMALTFEPHPTLVLQPEIERVYLAPERERLELMAATGLDRLVILTYDDALRRLSAEAFMTQVCRAIHVAELWVGPDFRMGYRAQGTLPVLTAIGERLGFAVHPVPPLLIDGAPVSATRIRELLHAGRVAEVPRLLGRPFTLEGEVVRGDQRGRTIGFPTANLAVDRHMVLPADGVYACMVRLPNGEQQPAVTNVGVRPTFGTLARTVEAHLLDWSGELYGQTLRVAFVERIRGEQRFSGIEALRAQIARDADQARALLRCR